jgi:ATP-dependent protease Clp ATPase subunit
MIGLIDQCSFCGKSKNAVAKLFTNDRNQVAICNECVTLCWEELASEESRP